MGIAIVPARHRFLACCQLALLLSLVPCGLGLAGEPEANAYRPPKDIAIPRPKPVEAPSPGDVDASLRRGIDFLCADQNKNGSWGGPQQTKGLNIFAPVPGAHHAFRAAVTAMAISALSQT